MRSDPVIANPATTPADKGRVALRLRAMRGILSIDLDTAVDLGPVTVRRLAYSLPGLRFPIDLSGGVARFRHRRGTLELVELECGLARLAAFCLPRIRSAWDSATARISLLPTDQGLVVGVVDDDRALAFNALIAADGHELRWLIVDARAVGLDVPAHAAALRVAEAALSGIARRTGSVLTTEDPLGEVVREILIDAGARTPDTEGVFVTSFHSTTDGVALHAARDAVPLVTSPQVLRALALSRIAERADNALAAGDLDRAREEYLLALESAPRHPDIALRIADLDLITQASAQAALAAVVDSMPAVDGGIVAARLLAAVGDLQAASVAARRAAETEPFAPLSSLLFIEASRFAPDHRDRAALVDEAVSRSPALATCRWSRARLRLAMGDVATAMNDFGSLEAASRGSRRRFETAWTAASLLLEHRQPAEAARLFERALRYAPRSIEATTGLARAFMSIGDDHRGAALLSRAVALTAKTPEPHADLLLELASALADVARDLPAGIAHARLVPFGLPQTVAARALEAQWRASLGDRDGATIAYAHAREAFEHLPPATAAGQISWLLKAAEFEEHDCGDRRCAFRHIEAALRTSPDDPSLRAAFRRLATANIDPQPASPPAASPTRPVEVAQQAPPSEPPPQYHAAPLASDVDQCDDVEPFDEAADEQRVATLTDRLRGNPSDHAVASELCVLLARLGRDMDLFALVAARLEETSDPHVRSDLEQHKRFALQRLASTARAEGRPDEASIYDEALAEMALEH